ncbi:hypothetical protein NPS01_32570 [Nocardioides psychrotolerans]|uniref:Uncharacterized protein n=1 Tax=Nocardioides psychrotolerans TaxID=1005945 RepID=A0A1I3NXF1_9ACTN|nr:hypothetical protein [Nocardioides psychrotolerans]GEP39594.1 hypothetical protein NPS01_32570 [Nocardioides psychrotolerans]SFJ13700.1 hypothetical protein SAMN05216561_11916 [Nocardioides psychrotolerans]
MTHDPDGHEVRFYTVEHHTETTSDQVRVVNDPDQVRVVNDAVETEDARMREVVSRRAGTPTV